jgi:hypothetical protein
MDGFGFGSNLFSYVLFYVLYGTSATTAHLDIIRLGGILPRRCRLGNNLELKLFEASGALERDIFYPIAMLDHG